MFSYRDNKIVHKRRRGVKSRARERGFKTVLARTGRAVLSLAGEIRPHALVIDVHLSDIEGWRVLQQIKMQPDLRHIPVVVTSAADVHDRALREGAIGALSRPVDRSTLQEAFTSLREFVNLKTIWIA